MSVAKYRDPGSGLFVTMPAAAIYAMNLSSGMTATVTHNLGTMDIFVSVYRLSDGAEIFVPYTRTSVNAILITSTVDLAGHRVAIRS
jgi:hypothetical protein